MWAEACEMLDRAERLHRQFFQIAPSTSAKPIWEPPVDVVETAKEVAIVVALPGVEPSQIEVAIEGNVLRVSGTRTMPSSFRSAAIHRLEIPHGRFERRIGLMWDQLRLTHRELVNGCMVLVFEKMA
jgi:HSP20 family molecular chaperone IbpA